jgi:NTP pyrophosphatase (non-canonical NTP hydrolase)
MTRHPSEGARLWQIFERIYALNLEEVELRFGREDETINNHFRHTVEEVGEMARCIRGVNDAPLCEEAVDTAVCALAIAMLETGGSVHEVAELFERKLDKWQANLEK